jgi:hypothetical protein
MSQGETTPVTPRRLIKKTPDPAFKRGEPGRGGGTTGPIYEKNYLVSNIGFSCFILWLHYIVHMLKTHVEILNNLLTLKFFS